MATWKKVLRQDYAVGSATDDLLNLSASVTSQTATISLTDDRTSPSEGAGLETISLAFSDAFDVTLEGGTDNQINIDLDADFTVTGDTGSITVDLNAVAASRTFAITASDDYLVTAASGSAVDITLDATQWDYTITGTGSPTPSSATHSIGDNITFGSTFGTVNAVVVAEATAGEITIDLDVAATTVQANGAGSSSFLPGETIDFTSDSLTIGVSNSGTAPNRTLTVDLEAKDVTINGDGTSTNTWSASTNAALNVKSATGSGLTVTASANTWTIDQGDYNISGTAGTASKTPINGLTFTSSDSSVTVTASGGGAQAVGVDLKATPKVTTDLAGTTTYYLLLQNGGNATDEGTADLDAFIDTGAAGNVGPQYTPSTGTLRVPNLVVDGTSTQLNVEQVTADDPLIIINNDGGALASNQGGIELNTGSGNAAHIVWNSANSNLTGWQVSDSGATQDLHSVAVMDHAGGAPSGGGAGSGTFYFDTTNKILYVDVA